MSNMKIGLPDAYDVFCYTARINYLEEDGRKDRAIYYVNATTHKQAVDFLTKHCKKHCKWVKQEFKRNLKFEIEDVDIYLYP